jgi:hypothetical protein
VGALATEAPLLSVLICIQYPGRVQYCFTFRDSAHHVLISQFQRRKKIFGRGLFQVSRIDESVRQTVSVWRLNVWRYDLQGSTNQDMTSPSEAPVSTRTSDVWRSIPSHHDCECHCGANLRSLMTFIMTQCHQLLCVASLGCDSSCELYRSITGSEMPLRHMANGAGRQDSQGACRYPHMQQDIAM